jgi:hypothetical protein
MTHGSAECVGFVLAAMTLTKPNYRTNKVPTPPKTYLILLMQSVTLLPDLL